jgi:hypothetical protein
MPSFHAQTIFYALTFFYQVKKSVKWTLIMGFISILTLFQRWEYKNHTIEQLAAGSFVGILVGLFGFESTKQAIIWNQRYDFFKKTKYAINI